jgi:hypothetical protein
MKKTCPRVTGETGPAEGTVVGSAAAQDQPGRRMLGPRIDLEFFGAFCKILEAPHRLFACGRQYSKNVNVLIRPISLDVATGGTNLCA